MKSLFVANWHKLFIPWVGVETRGLGIYVGVCCMFGSLWSCTCTFTYTYIYRLCVSTCVIMYTWCECAGSGGGSVSWGLLWNVSARPVSEPWDGQTWNQSGKAPQRGGRRMTRVWMGVGVRREGRGGLSQHPRPQKAPGPTVPWKEPLWGPGCSACVGLRPQTHTLPTWYIYVLFYHSLSQH